MFSCFQKRGSPKPSFCLIKSADLKSLATHRVFFLHCFHSIRSYLIEYLPCFSAISFTRWLNPSRFEYLFLYLSGCPPTDPSSLRHHIPGPPQPWDLHGARRRSIHAIPFPLTRFFTPPRSPIHDDLYSVAPTYLVCRSSLACSALRTQKLVMAVVFLASVFNLLLWRAIRALGMGGGEIGHWAGDLSSYG